MDINESVALNFISEMKKPGRECLYDMSNSSYKNNHKKKSIWLEIANAIGMESSKCQSFWKTLRRRHKAAINKNDGKSGSERVEVKGFSKVLLNEMDYFLNFWEDKEPTVTNYTDSNMESFRNLFDEMARDSEIIDLSSECSECPTTSSQSSSLMSSTPIKGHRRKQRKFDIIETEYKESLKTLNTLAATVLQSSTEKKIDPFFLALEDEFSKVPDSRKSALKLKLMSLILENQE